MLLTNEHAALHDEFLTYESTRGARPRHVSGMRARVVRFLNWLEDSGLNYVDINHRTARNYQVWLMESQTKNGTTYQIATVMSYRKAAASFSRFLVETKRIPANPFHGLRAPRLPKNVLEGVLKEADMARLLHSLQQWETDSNLRTQTRRYILHVIAEVQYASGLRIAEMAELKEEDIDLERRIIIVRQGKMGRDRIAYLSEYATSVLSIYLKRMRPLVLARWNAAHMDYVFGCSFDSLSHFVNRHLASVGQELGLTITSHGFRHALGYHLLRAGCPLRHIQEIMGHQNLKDTEVYTKVDVTNIQNVLDEHHPRGRHAV